MHLFDTELRDTPEWQGWDERQAYKYAISFDGRLYPVKQVISLATNVPTYNFSGGDEANNYVRRYGFSVRALPRREAPAVWWVNQGQSYRQEAAGGYLWAPIKNKRGAAERHWDHMDEVHAGDLIVHHSDGAIRAVSRATDDSEWAPKPSELENFPWEAEADW